MSIHYEVCTIEKNNVHIDECYNINAIILILYPHAVGGRGLANQPLKCSFCHSFVHYPL